MLKLLIFLLLLGLLLALVYWRLRPYIATARRVLGFVRDLRSMGGDGPVSGGPLSRSSAQGERLVRCLSCGTWTPLARAVTLGRSGGASNYYCSHTCLERAAEDNRQRAPRRSQR